jgi:hypothetical protein
MEWADETIVDHRDVARDDPRASAAREAFIIAWRKIPPALRTVRFAGPGSRTTTVFTAARAGDLAHARADRLVAAEVVRRGITPQRATGRAATRLLAELCDAADAALARMVATFDPRSLRTAADEVERIWEMRFASEQQRAVRTDLTPAKVINLEQEEATTARAADHLLEMLVATQPSGAARLDHRDWILLLHLASACLGHRDNLAAAQCGLLTFDVLVRSDGLIESDIVGTLLDLRRHRAEVIESNAQHVASLVEDIQAEYEPDDTDDNPFSSLRASLEAGASNLHDQRQQKHDKLMLAVDDAIRKEMGTDLDAISAVLMTAAAWHVPGDPYELTAEVSVEQFVDSVAEWCGIGRQLIHGAVRWLTLSASLIRTERLPYWAMEGPRRPLDGTTAHSYGRPPATAHPARRAAAGRRVLANYLLDSRLAVAEVRFCRSPWKPPYAPCTNTRTGRSRSRSRRNSSAAASSIDVARSCHGKRPRPGSL